MPGDDEDNVGGKLRRDFGALFKAGVRFAESGLEGLAGDDDDEPAPAPAVSVRVPRSPPGPTTPARARPVVIDVEPDVAGACSYCGMGGGGGRIETRGRDGRVRSVPCPECGGR
jgi:hypothetical protein